MNANLKSALSLLVSIALLANSYSSFSQQKFIKTSDKITAPLVSGIREDDLKKDLFAMAGDHFKGREAGTLDELKVSVWLANQASAAGLKPAGDDDTYFQFFSMWRNRISLGSKVQIGDSSFKLWEDVLISQTSPATINAPIVFVGKGSKDDLDKVDIKGKVVALQVSADGINLDVSLAARRYPGYVIRKYSGDILAKGAVAIILIADELGEKSWSQVTPQLSRGTYDIAGGTGQNVTARPPVFWLHSNAIDFIKRSGLTLNTSINIEHYEYPSVNIVGKIDGTDPALKNEYVLFSGHQDHDGVRQPYGNDSIYNGADDNATVSVALLAIARAFNKQPGRRSSLFVWHGAEERGLLGSRWFSANPTVDKASIVAVLNGDMIGRNTPDSAALLGAQPPHRNSPELVAMAMDANKEGPAFKLDTLWDKTQHVEGWYFRSDHLPYARAGIPALFYTTLLHPDYHTPMDEAKSIDVKKLKRVTEWMYRTGWKVANTTKRPAVEAGFKLER
jgi:hypothetical protein